jgi:acyl carrier protein phosphodiesterase
VPYTFYLCSVNYLAHAYLSFGEPEILAGNLISDFVKGKKKFDYPPVIQKGIMLHRAIDEFTDTHQATKQAKLFFRPAYGLYAGAFMDIVYDHFLANDEKEFPDEKVLAVFTQKTYRQLMPYEPALPEKFRRFFYYMRLQDWLYNYRFTEGINNSFAGLVRRAAYIHDHQAALEVFEKHYLELKACYEIFFPALKHFAYGTLQKLNAAD